MRIASGFSMNTGGFARLAQATHLLSQSLRSVASTPTKEEMRNHDQTLQLRRTLLALVHAADSEALYRRLDFCASSEISFRYAISIHVART